MTAGAGVRPGRPGRRRCTCPAPSCSRWARCAPSRGSPRRSAPAQGWAGTSTTTTCSSAASCCSAPATSPTWSRPGSRRSTGSRTSCARGPGGRRRVRAGRLVGAARAGVPADHSVGLGLPRRSRSSWPASGPPTPGSPTACSVRGGLGADLRRHRLRPGRHLRLPARHGRPARRRPAHPRSARRRRHLDGRRARAPATASPTTSTRSAAPTTGSPRSSACPTPVPARRLQPRRPGGRGRHAADRDRRRVHPVPAGRETPLNNVYEVTAVGREAAMRARQPDTVASASSGTGSRSATRCSSPGRGRAPTLVLLTVVGDRARAAVEGAGALPRPALPGGHRRGPGQRRRGPAADRRRLRRPRVRRRRRRRAWTPPASDRAVRRRAVAGRAARAAARRLVPGPGGRRGRDRGGAALARRRPGLRRGPRTGTRAGRRPTGTTGSPTTAAGSSSSCPQVVHRAALDQAASRTASAGGWRPTRETLAAARSPGIDRPTEADAEAICRAVRCPVLVVHGERRRDRAVRDRRRSWPRGPAATSSRCPTAATRPPLRDPVRTNLLIREFVESLAGPRPRPRTLDAGPAAGGARALFVSSPIGLGHARRDVAIADELRARHPDLEIDWLAQDPVTRVLADRGERVHPASRLPGRASARTSSPRPGEHDLHAFQAIRRMDEILVANFHVFHDVVDRRAATTWWSPTRAGTSTTSCTRTPSSSGRRTPG